MAGFATLPDAERRLIVEDVAGRLGVVPVILEKDFWVVWALGRMFADPEVAPHVVFKGGTSLAKVFDAIQRFSEDIDLAIAPDALGFTEEELNDAPSPSQRRKRMQALATAAERYVVEKFEPALEASARAVLGTPRGDSWFRYEIDALAGTPNLLFTYPSVLPQAGGYIAKQVKLEFGALANQQPTTRRRITAMLASAPGTSLAQVFDDLSAEVVVLAFERTFWEKATILHAEFHRPAEAPIRDRFSRHYADFAALWRHSGRDLALARVDLLQDVVLHKSRFFASSWARYESAMPGTFRLVPPAPRHSALGQDYARMLPMFLQAPPTFDEVLRQLAEAEQWLNRR